MRKITRHSKPPSLRITMPLRWNGNSCCDWPACCCGCVAPRPHITNGTQSFPGCARTCRRSCAQLARCFLRLASLPNYALDRLSRYEATLWRQAGRSYLVLRLWIAASPRIGRVVSASAAGESSKFTSSRNASSRASVGSNQQYWITAGGGGRSSFTPPSTSSYWLGSNNRSGFVQIYII
jgi:hypothetical protein